jgi:Domain of unknown function (DUF4062)
MAKSTRRFLSRGRPPDVDSYWDDGVVEKRYQVFVSSTYTDLTAERAAVIEAVLGLRHLPAGMEMFPAANEDQWSLIERVIDESDYYVVVIGGRYGSVNDTGISYTEREYDYAIETETPVLGFLHKSPGDIVARKTDESDEAREKLKSFREKVQGRPVKYFTNADQLGGQVALSLVALVNNEPAIGWVRGDKAMTVEQENEILELRRQLTEAKAERDSAQNALVEDTSELAQGDDVVTIPLRVTGQKLEDGQWKSYRFDTHVSTTWDELFGDIGPTMIDEATERAVRERTQQHAFGMLDDEARTAHKAWRSMSGTLFDDEWDMIRVQFRALGLIENGHKKRQINDKSKYLALTEKGDRHLTYLRAVRREAVKPNHDTPEPHRA